MHHAAPTTVLWDFGGVMTASPFEAFNRFEAEHDIPIDFIRRVNSVDSDNNAWARIERHELSIDEFDAAFAVESAALGYRIAGRDLLRILSGTVRPEMVTALDSVIAAGYGTACLTNNFVTRGVRPDIDAVMARFGAVVESSKVGCRKPEPRFYEIACATLGVEPSECVFLDDLGINLKPARAMGMTTIKVTDASSAITELEGVLGIDLA